MLSDLPTALLVETADVEGLSDCRDRLLVRSHIIVQETQEKSTDLTNRDCTIVTHLKGTLDALEYLYQIRKEILVKLIIVIEVVLALLKPRALTDRIEEDLNRVK